MASISLSTSGPKQSGAWMTFLPSNCERRLDAGAMVYFGFFSPFGLPRWEARTTFAPCSMAYLMVGTAPAIRESSVMLPFSSWGTLKSTLMKTFLPLRSFNWSIYRIGIRHLHYFDEKKRGNESPSLLTIF